MDIQQTDLLSKLVTTLGGGWQPSLAALLWATVSLLRGDFKVNIPAVTEVLAKLTKFQTTALIMVAAALAGIVGQVTFGGHVPHGVSEWTAIWQAGIQGVKVALMAGGVNSIWANVIKKQPAAPAAPAIPAVPVAPTVPPVPTNPV